MCETPSEKPRELRTQQDTYKDHDSFETLIIFSWSLFSLRLGLKLVIDEDQKDGLHFGSIAVRETKFNW